MAVDPVARRRRPRALLAFEHVSLPLSRRTGEVLRHASFALERGKTYAFVGPTGGGKTTTASLMARLYDPTSGRVLLDGRDIRAYAPAERAERIGFILQEPFLFTGTSATTSSTATPRSRDFSDEQITAGAARTLDLDAPARPLRRRPRHGGDVGRRRHQPWPEAADRLHARGAARSRHPDPRRGDRQHRHGHRAAARGDPREAAGDDDAR